MSSKLLNRLLGSNNRGKLASSSLPLTSQAADMLSTSRFKSASHLKHWAALSALLFASNACNDSFNQTPAPTFANGGEIRLGERLAAQSLLNLEGRFKLIDGEDLLGSDLVVTTGLNSVSLLTGKDAAVAALDAACIDQKRVILEGHWRYPRDSRVGLEVVGQANARALCQGLTPPEPLIFAGYYGNDTEFPTRDLKFSFTSDLIPYRGKFFSVAHHGACELADACGVSPNSLETILLADRYGATAMEIDIRTTLDNIPILFHDPNFGSNSTQGIFCQGAVDSLNMGDIQASCRLAYGEKIPDVDEALSLLIDQTAMEFTYLDMKVPSAVAPSAKIAAVANQAADVKGRRFRAIVALTNDDVTSAWKDYVSTAAPEDIPPCLVEYDSSLVSELGCVAWGPTWTEGTRAEEVEQVRSLGGRVVYWTLNDDNFIDAFLSKTNPDGAITSRTGLLMYLYQTLGVVPPAPTQDGGTSP